MARVAVWGRLSCLPAALNSTSWSHHELQFLGHPGLSWPTGPLALTRYLLVAGNASVILAHGDEVAQIKSGTNRLGLRWLERTDMFFYIIWQAPLLERVARLALPTRDRHKSVHGRRVMARHVWQFLHVIAALSQGWNGSADQVARSIDWEGVMAELLEMIRILWIWRVWSSLIIFV